MLTAEYAPGWPGIPPGRWASGAANVGTAPTFSDRVWFTLSHGILNEVYWPSQDQACIRDMGLVVTDGREYFSCRSGARSPDQYLADGVPGVPGSSTRASTGHLPDREGDRQ